MVELGENVINDAEEFITEVQSTEFSDTEKVSTLHQIVEGLGDINDGIEEGKELWNTLGEFVEKLGLSIVFPFLEMLFLPIVGIVGLVLYFRNARLNKKCKAQICKETGEYLNEKINEFWQEKEVQLQVEKSFEEITEKVRNTYEHILEETFGMALYDEKEDENSCVSRLFLLSDEWEKIKRGNL